MTLPVADVPALDEVVETRVPPDVLFVVLRYQLTVNAMPDLGPPVPCVHVVKVNVMAVAAPPWQKESDVVCAETPNGESILAANVLLLLSKAITTNTKLKILLIDPLVNFFIQFYLHIQLRRNH